VQQRVELINENLNVNSDGVKI